MAEGIVSSVLLTLGQLIIREAIAEPKLLSVVKAKVEDAKLELRMMRSFLKDADAKARGGDEKLRDWVLEITEAAYDLEDVVATFVLKEEAAARKGRVMRFSCLFKRASERHKVGSMIDLLSNRISKLTQGLQTYGVTVNRSNERQNDLRRTYSHIPEHDFVGFGKIIEELVERLTDPASGVVSICGMGGLGKTALAKQVYDRIKVKNHFDHLAWVCVSQQFQPKEILEEILFNLLSPSDEQRKEIKSMSKGALVTKLHQELGEKKCVVALDDVWTVEAWEILKNAFPENTKILITTRIKDVAEHAKKGRSFIWEPRHLKDDESWELLEKKASYLQGIEVTNPKDFAEMKELGNKMLKHCGGLPLAVVVLGGLLSEKQTLAEWKTLDENVKELVNKGQSIDEQHQGVLWVLGLSYDELPYQLKPCFLHLANFPEDCEINVKELCRLWAAEGFVLNDNEAHKYLMALVYKGMVQVGKRSSIVGRIKTCRMHDLMRDLCLEKARNENFLSLINFQEVGGSGLSTQVMRTGKVRRLAVHSNENIVSELLPLTHNRDGCLRSLLCFSPDEDLPNPRDLFKPLLNCFYMLRVLKFENFITYRNIFPKEIGRLVHLRFLRLPYCCGGWDFRLPSSMANLRCLQTLDLGLSLNLLSIMFVHSINFVISKLDHLRHLYLPTVHGTGTFLDPLCVQFVKPFQLRLGHLKSLETLVRFDTRYCNVDDLSQLIKLTKLLVTTQKDSREIKPTSNLQSLRLNNVFRSNNRLELKDIVPSLSSYLRIQKLGFWGKFKSLQENYLPPNLVKVSMNCSYLENDPMLVLGKLSKLRILNLGFESYNGEKMDCCKDSFPQLESLSIDELTNLKEWRVKEGALSKLCHLKIQKCKKLKSYPRGLRNITTLKEIEIRYMSKGFKTSFEQGRGDEDCHNEIESAN